MDDYEDISVYLKTLNLKKLIDVKSLVYNNIDILISLAMYENETGKLKRNVTKRSLPKEGFLTEDYCFVMKLNNNCAMECFCFTKDIRNYDNLYVI